MNNQPALPELSEFLQYLAKEHEDGGRLPASADLGRLLGVSLATLREQMEVARALGVVEVRPRTGIRRQPYQFTPAVLTSLSYAAAIDPDYYFHAFANFRTHIEAAYFQQAVQLLTDDDRCALERLIAQAFGKLGGSPIQIPYDEHRELHMLIYRRLDNPFVSGVLEAYWAAYEALGLGTYADIAYLKTVWTYHRKMVEAICRGDYASSYRLLMEHTDLLEQRNSMDRHIAHRQGFE